MQSQCTDELVEIIEIQNKMIAELTNRNAEQENMINVLMSEFSDV